MTERDDEPVGYGRPPVESRFQRGRSGNPKGRPKNARAQIPFEDVLGREVTVREGGEVLRMTAEEAFVRKIRQLAISGAKSGLPSIVLDFMRAFNALDSGRSHGEPKVVFSFVEPGGVLSSLEALKMGQMLNPMDAKKASVKLEPWIVEAALKRRPGHRFTKDEQKTIVAATRTPHKVNWPSWWVIRPRNPYSGP